MNQMRMLTFLSAIFSRAIRDEIVDFNPCSRFEQEQEARRERYLIPSEQSKLMEVLYDDPMNSPVRAALQKVIDTRTTGSVFDYSHTGVSASTLRRGFEKACERAGIPFSKAV
jgi:hypothetical protein